MRDLSASERNRLHELLADEALGQLGPEESAELEALRRDDGDEPESDEARFDEALGELIVAFDRAEGGAGMPAEVRERIVARGRGIAGTVRPGASSGGSRRLGLWLSLAAIVLLTASTIVLLVQLGERDERLQAMRERVESNEMLLASARERVSELEGFEAEALELAERLNEVTSELDRARFRIAELTTPLDPEELKTARQTLARLPETIRVEWQPFEAEGLPPVEQPGVTGDVVWNDRLEEGYMRFVGLDPNDPDVEQYQVWVIDERGMEQKVSGGVFDVTAEGEVIVPIHPGIDVGRVALIAVTVEDSGGTWVPDLRRRVVVAPRG